MPLTSLGPERGADEFGVGFIDFRERGVDGLAGIWRQPVHVIRNRSQGGADNLQVFIQNLRRERGSVHGRFRRQPLRMVSLRDENFFATQIERFSRTFGFDADSTHIEPEILGCVGIVHARIRGGRIASSHSERCERWSGFKPRGDRRTSDRIAAQSRSCI